MNWSLVENSLFLLQKGLATTLYLIIASSLIGFLVTFFLVGLRLSRCSWFRGLAKSYSLFFRGTPILIQMYLCYYGLGDVKWLKNCSLLWWFFEDGFRCSIIVLCLNFSAYLSEIFYGGLENISLSIKESAQALGLQSHVIFFKITLPLALRQILPSIGNEMILLSKSTSIASTITVMEMTAYSKRLMSQTLAASEIFFAAAFLYLLINAVIYFSIRCLESILKRKTANAFNRL